MAPAAALKKPAETDSRQALAVAIAAHRRSTAELAAQQAAIHRATEVVQEIEREIAKAAAAAQAVEDLVTMRERRGQQEVLNDRLTLARAEVERLSKQLKEKELAVAFAANVVAVERNQLLAPVAAAVLARIRAHRLELLKDRCLLAMIINADGPEFSKDPRSFFQIKEGEAACRKAFGAVRADAARDAADLATASNGCNLAECETAYMLTEQWKRECAALLKDPNAKLPGEK